MFLRSLIFLLISFAAAPQSQAAGEPVPVPWPARRAVPALDLPDLDGKVWTLGDLRGRVVLLNFWASWCEPCRAEMPALQDLASVNDPQQLSVLSVNYQQGASTVRRYLADAQLALPALLDRDGNATKAWSRRIFPTTVVIDRLGQPRFTIEGEFDWRGAQAQALLAPLLKPLPAPPASTHSTTHSR